MSLRILLDVVPDPVRGGVALGVALVVVVFVLVLVGVGALVFFLWLRKRSMRHLEIGTAENDHQFPQK